MFLYLIAVSALVLSVIYLCITLYSRSVRREKLEDWWDEKPVDGVTREAYIADGMEAYRNGLRRKLILLVFVIPPLVALTIIYFIN